MSRRSGVLVAALTIWLGAGPLVLDQCLVGCHQDGSAATSPPAPLCHEAAHDSNGTLWQRTTLCHHDHCVSSAEAIAEAAPESLLKIVHAALVSQSAPPLRTMSTPARAATTPPSGGAIAAAFPRPLRV